MRLIDSFVWSKGCHLPLVHAHYVQADLTNICMRFVAAVLGGFENSLMVDRLPLCLPTDVAKLEKSPEYLYPEALRKLFEKFSIDLYHMSDSHFVLLWGEVQAVAYQRPMPSDRSFLMVIMFLDSSR